MKVYSVADDKTIEAVVLCVKANAACAQLHWSKKMKDIPRSVVGALETVEQFAESRIEALCDKELFSLSQEEEDRMLQVIRDNPDLKDSLGMGVISAGEQADKVIQVMQNEKGLERICAALRRGENIVIF